MSGFLVGSTPSTHFSSVKRALPEAFALLGKRATKKIAHNTYLRREGDSAVMRFHATDIVKIGPDRMVLDSGGWRTFTTKDRLNSLLPAGYSLCARLGVWHLCTPRTRSTGKTYVFADGCTILASGRVANVGDEKAQTTMRRKVHAYAKAFADAAVAGKLHAPGAGDCFYCGMVVSEGPDKGKSLGEATHDADHVRGHVDEMYLVPSLLVNAAKECADGYLLNYGLGILWSTDLNDAERAARIEREGSTLANRIGHVVRRYVGRRVGLATR